MKTISIGVIAICAIGLALNIRRLRQRRVSVGVFLAWVALTLGLSILFAFPGMLGGVSTFLGMQNFPFFVSVVGILVALFFVFVAFDKAKQNELRLMRAIQQISIVASDVEEMKRKSDR